jgi:uncharacterized protein (DUF2236 family)
MTDGYFPQGSILRRVHSERAVGLLYGQRALMIGALNPLAFIGTMQRTNRRQSTWKRLGDTAEMFEAVMFGTREEADRALRISRKLHERVSGGIPEQAGPYPPGTRYDAFDPELMMWVIAPMYDSAVVLYELLVRGLSGADKQQLWQEYLLFGELFGMPREHAPQNVEALEAWWQRQWSDDRIFLTDHARAVGRKIGYKLPVPAPAQPAFKTMGLLLTGSLPARVRAEYRLQWSLADELAFRALTWAARIGRPILPAQFRRGPTLPFYDLVRRLGEATPSPAVSG